MARSDDEPFERLVEEHGRAVEALLGALERDGSAREDLWADVFEIAFARFDQLCDRSSSEVRAWLFRTTRFVVANAARRSTSRSKATERLAAEPVHPQLSAEDHYLGL